MKRLMLMTALAVAALGCGPEMADENPSCCLYECEGPRQEWFSSYFGSDAECTDLVTSRCELEFPDQPGVKRIEYEGGVAYDEDQGLNAVCESRFATFETNTSTSS